MLIDRPIHRRSNKCQQVYHRLSGGRFGTDGCLDKITGADAITVSFSFGYRSSPLADLTSPQQIFTSSDWRRMTRISRGDRYGDVELSCQSYRRYDMHRH